MKHHGLNQTKCVMYAYPSSAWGGKDGGWISATYKNALATEPMEQAFFNKKEDALNHAEKTWPNYPWDKYRHCE